MNVLSGAYGITDPVLRQSLKVLSDAASRAITNEINTSDDLPTSNAVKIYVDKAIEGLTGLEIVIDEEGTESGPSVPPSASTMMKLYLVPDRNTESSYVEWITIRLGEEGSYIYKWEQIGSTKVDLADYVKKITTIAGVKLDHNITALELIAGLGLIEDTVAAEGMVTTVEGEKLIFNEARLKTVLTKE